MRKLDNVTRVEVIDENGRSYVNWDKNNKIEVQFQDGGRTMKIFIGKKKTEEFDGGFGVGVFD